MSNQSKLKEFKKFLNALGSGKVSIRNIRRLERKWDKKYKGNTYAIQKQSTGKVGIRESQEVCKVLGQNNQSEVSSDQSPSGTEEK